MQRLVFNIPLNCELIFSSCQHIGSRLCHYKGIEKMINHVSKSKSRFVILLGDIIEAITTDDKRYHSDGTKEPIPLKQMKEAVEIFKPIKNNLLTALGGNHELKLYRYGNLVEDVFCDSLGIPYGTRTARIAFHNDGRDLFKTFITHDVPIFKSRAKDFLQRQANILAAMKVSLEYRMGDCALMVCGHPHQLLVIEPSPLLYLVDGKDGVQQKYLSGDMGDGGFINPDQRWYGCAGSFRKKYVDGIDDYSDIYDPVELGYLVCTVRDGKIANLEKRVV